MADFHTHGPHTRDNNENPFSENCRNISGCPDQCTHVECHGLGKLYNCQWHDSTLEYRCWHEGVVNIDSITANIGRIREELESLEIDLEVLKRSQAGKG